MINVLIVAKDLQMHGISTVIMNYFRSVNSEEIHMDFAVGKPVDEEYIEEIEQSGCKIYLLPAKQENANGYYKELYRVMKEHRYDILHVHGNSATISIELLMGKLTNIPVRIAHSHNSTCNHVLIHKLLSPFMHLVSTHGFACSKMAGDWMFKKYPYEIIKNGFNTKQFVFDEKRREEIREYINVKDEYVIGHIGFFNEQKNQRFLIDVFNEFLKKHENSKLLLVGGGYKKIEIEDYVRKNKLSDHVIFYGETKDVPSVLAAMDCFVFPSLFEGLGIVLLEAQINGLPCVVSDVVPQETKLGESYYKLSLEDNIDKWANKIYQCLTMKVDRKNFYDNHRIAIEQYDITENSLNLSAFYNNYLEEKRG